MLSDVNLHYLTWLNLQHTVKWVDRLDIVMNHPLPLRSTQLLACVKILKLSTDRFETRTHVQRFKDLTLRAVGTLNFNPSLQDWDSGEYFGAGVGKFAEGDNRRVSNYRYFTTKEPANLITRGPITSRGTDYDWGLINTQGLNKGPNRFPPT